MMFTDADVKPPSLLADVTDNSCRLKYVEIVPLTGDTDGPCTTDCDTGDWSAQVRDENMSITMQDPEDVRCIVFNLFCDIFSKIISFMWM